MIPLPRKIITNLVMIFFLHIQHFLQKEKKKGIRIVRDWRWVFDTVWLSWVVFGEAVALSQPCTTNLYFLFIKIIRQKNINNNIKESTHFKAHIEGNESFWWNINSTLILHYFWFLPALKQQAETISKATGEHLVLLGALLLGLTQLFQVLLKKTKSDFHCLMLIIYLCIQQVFIECPLHTRHC